MHILSEYHVMGLLFITWSVPGEFFGKRRGVVTFFATLETVLNSIFSGGDIWKRPLKNKKINILRFESPRSYLIVEEPNIKSVLLREIIGASRAQLKTCIF